MPLLLMDKKFLYTYGLGKIIIQLKGKQAEPIVFSEVWYAPHAGHRPLSVPMLTSQGYKCTINNCESNIWDTNEHLVIQAKALSPNNNLHWFQSKRITPTDSSIHLLAKEDSYDLWHHHLGHLSKNAICAAPSHVTGMPTVTLLDQQTPCKSCTLGKMHDHSYPPSDTLSNKTVAIPNPDTVREAHCNHLWEFRLYLVRENDVHTLGYKSLPGVM